MAEQHVMVLGVGNLLFSDEGFGIRVVEELERRYTFPDNVSIVDGGVLGVSLLGIMSEADHLIVVDVIRNQGAPGDHPAHGLRGVDLDQVGAAHAQLVEVGQHRFGAPGREPRPRPRAP